MSSDQLLANAFLTDHPEVAARLLESMPPESASEALAGASPAAAGIALHRMLPTAAARCAELLSESVVATLIDGLPTQAGAALLRHFSPAAREGVLAQSSPARKAVLALLLKYPASAVGAWMEPRVLTLPDDCTIGEARERAQRDAVAQPRIYVLDRNRKICGAVRGSSLSRSTGSGRLGSLVEPSDALWAREAVARAHERDLWERESEAPVINRDEEFIGIVSISDLRRGLKQISGFSTIGPVAGEAGEFGELFRNSFEGTWQSLTELLSPPERSR